MIKKVCLITNYNLYESKRHFCQKLAEALERASVETLVIDTKEEAIDVSLAKKIQSFQPDLTCSFNTLEPLYEDQFLWDLLKIPHLAFLVDPAFYSINLINSPYSIVSCVDRDDVNSILGEGFQNVFFMPHAVERDLFDQPREKKAYEAVFIGTCYDYENLEKMWKRDLALPLQRILGEAIEIFEESPRINLDEALKEAWSHSNLTPNPQYILELYHYLDSYTRGKDRINLIKSLEGVDIHIFGTLSKDTPGAEKGWKEYFEGYPSVHVHDSVNLAQSFQILRQSKLCLNSMPFFKNGSHERVFNGYACDCLPLTTENCFMRELFVEGEDICFYFKKVQPEANIQIRKILKDEEWRSSMVEKGKSKVRKSHTWDQRARELKEILPSLLHRVNRLTKPTLQ